MTSRDVAYLNRATEALYRHQLGEPVVGIATVIGLQRKSTKVLLRRASNDPRVLKSVAARRKSDEQRVSSGMDAEFKDSGLRIEGKQ